ncbi:MAG: NADP-dependent oxidoreductase [Geminicoccaceae bacterium]|nr:NADP-dependent oxidoreductase [Geminicoccaceae bacterium]
MPETNRRWLLNARPEGRPGPDAFRLDEAPAPAPAEGEVLCRTLWLSLDPYMRGRMNAGKSYAKGVAPGEVMTAEVVAEVVESRAPGFAPGDVVRAPGGWQTRFALKAEALAPLRDWPLPVQTALGVLGMPGLTAYAALDAIARPAEGETVVVPAATGAVGSVFGQLAREKGARVVGVAGGPDKCAEAVDFYGFDACLDRRAPGFADDLAAACPDGVDVYAELVGGPVSGAVLPLLNDHARIPVIGLIAGYNATAPAEGPDRLPLLMRHVLTKRLRIEGFIVFDHEDRRPAFLRKVGALAKDGRLRYREDAVEGFENAPEAFLRLFDGANRGKLLVKVG